MVETIKIDKLQLRVEKHPNVAAADSLLKNVNILSVKGLHGSSRAIFAVGMYRKHPRTYLYILNDAETAGYFYHDVLQLIGPGDVMFFPSHIRGLQNTDSLMRQTRYCEQSYCAGCREKAAR